MKNLFRNKKLMGLCLVAAIFVSCKHPELENKEKEMEEHTIQDFIRNTDKCI